MNTGVTITCKELCVGFRLHYGHATVMLTVSLRDETVNNWSHKMLITTEGNSIKERSESLLRRQEESHLIQRIGSTWRTIRSGPGRRGAGHEQANVKEGGRRGLSHVYTCSVPLLGEAPFSLSSSTFTRSGVSKLWPATCFDNKMLLQLSCIFMFPCSLRPLLQYGGGVSSLPNKRLSLAHKAENIN